MRCLICKTYIVTKYITDELCGLCYYTTHNKKLDDYFVEIEIIEYFREIILERYNYTVKKCNMCKNIYPKNNIYFYVQGKYFRSTCKSCYNSKKS